MSPTRILPSILCLVVLLATSGCSLFGVATKTELETQSVLAKRQNDALTEENRRLRARLSEVEKRLQQVQASYGERAEQLQAALERADEDRAQLWTQAQDLDTRVLGMEDDVTAATNAAADLNSEFEVVDARVRAVDQGVAAVRSDLGVVEGSALSALTRSERLVRLRLEELRRERRQLLDELRALESELEAWGREAELRRPSAGELPGVDLDGLDLEDAPTPGETSR